jgi:hypothetical protein
LEILAVDEIPNQIIGAIYNIDNKVKVKKSKAVPLHAMEARGGRGGIAPTHT